MIELCIFGTDTPQVKKRNNKRLNLRLNIFYINNKTTVSGNILSLYFCIQYIS